MIDFERVRAYYFNPPPRDPLSVPSDEELIARHERLCYESCILRSGDPVAEGLGPHGSMIGGPGKPITIHYERVERTAPLRPLPLAWWDYPQARRRILPPGGRDEATAYLGDLLGLHMAGVPNRPSAPGLAAIFRTSHPAPPDREILRQLFGALPAPRFKRLRTLGGISLYEMARAIHVSGNRRNAFVRWLHRFAVRPPSTDARGPGRTS